MAVRLYMDVHIPQAITDQLRRMSVDVLTALEDNASELPDDQLLQRATNLGRVLFTHDIRFYALAVQWQRDGREFGGLIFGHPLQASIGQYVRDLHLIATASDPSEWRQTIEHLPYR